jgi:hypothetical protein
VSELYLSAMIVLEHLRRENLKNDEPVKKASPPPYLALDLCPRPIFSSLRNLPAIHLPFL